MTSFLCKRGFCTKTALLVYFVVMYAVGYVPVRKAAHANIAPVSISEAIKVLQPHYHNGGVIRFQDVINVGLGESLGWPKNAEETSASERHPFILWHSGNYLNWRLRWFWKCGCNSWRNNNLALIWVSNLFVSDSVKPQISLFLSVWANKYFSRYSHLKSWGLPKVIYWDICPHSLASLNADGWPDIGGPKVWSLIYLKLSRRILNSLSSQTSLPSGYGCVGHDDHESQLFPKQFFGFKSPIFLALGCVLGRIFLALGIMLIDKVLRRVGLDGTMNVDRGFVLAILSAILLLIGQWMLASVFGLLPFHGE